MLGVHGVHGMWRKSLAEWLRGYCGVFPLGFDLKKKKKKHLNAFAGQPVDKWDPTAIQSMAWSRMERRVAII